MITIVHRLIASSMLVTSVLAQGSLFQCDRPSNNNRGDLIDTIVGLDWCLDSDPLPSELLEPSPLNVAAASQANGGGPAIVDLGHGSYVYGDGSYMTNLFVFEPVCTNGSKMNGKKGGKKGGKKQIGEDNEHHVIEKACHELCETGRYGAVLVDAPPALGPDFGAFIRDFLDSIDADLVGLIITHEHYDHAGNGNSVMDANPDLKYYITSSAVKEAFEGWININYSNPRLAEIMNPNPNYPKYPFTDVFEERAMLIIGNQTIELEAREGHTPGNLIIWHEASKTITNVDGPAYPKWSPFFELGLGTNIPQLYKAFDIYREYDFEYFVAGHFSHIGTPEDVAISEEYTIDIADAAYRALTESFGDPTSSANLNNVFWAVLSNPDNAGNINLIFGEFLRQVAAICVDIVLDSTQNYSGKNWIETLAGTRVTVFSHCEALADALRVDLPGM